MALRSVGLGYIQHEFDLKPGWNSVREGCTLARRIETNLVPNAT